MLFLVQIQVILSCPQLVIQFFPELQGFYWDILELILSFPETKALGAYWLGRLYHHCRLSVMFFYVNNFKAPGPFRNLFRIYPLWILGMKVCSNDSAD